MFSIAHFLQRKSKNLLSVDFGEGATKIVYLECAGKAYNILNYSIKKIPLDDDKASELISDFIRDFISQNSINSKDIVLTISERDSIVIKYLILPVLAGEEVFEAAKWQLKEDMPFDIENCLVDWQVIREYTEEDGAKKNGIIFILAKEDTVKKYIAIVKSAGLNPIKISSSSFNYANILSNLESTAVTAGVLDIGYQEAAMSAYYQNKLIFLRKLNFSSDKITRALTVPLSSEKGKIELSYEQAENIKDTYGIPQDLTQLVGDNIQAGQILSLIRPYLEGLVREIRLTSEYFSFAKQNLERPSIFYLAGGGAQLKNLDKYLSKEFGLQVLPLPLPGNVNTSVIKQEQFIKDAGSIVSSVGACIQGVSKINLLPPEIKEAKVAAIQGTSFRLAAIIFGAILLFTLSISQFRINDYKKRLKSADMHLAALEQVKVLKEKIDLREGLINKIEGNRIPVDGLLKLVSANIPQEVVLSELDFDQSSNTLILEGTVSSGEEAANSILTNFTQNLEKSSFCIEASLMSSQRSGAVQIFEIKCDLAS